MYMCVCMHASKHMRMQDKDRVTETDTFLSQVFDNDR